jgi:hypothetical protein
MFPVAGGTRRDGYENEAVTSVAGEEHWWGSWNETDDGTAWVEKGRERKGKAQGRPKPGSS